ncbi:putative sugar O-methyltransferase (plasmid) [Streptomyces sp. QTS137]
MTATASARITCSRSTSRSSSAGTSARAARVLEIGAGYGRTCHAMLSHHRVEEHWIPDPGRALPLSWEHLRTVPGHRSFSRVGLVSVDDADDLDRALGAGRFDLCPNIDSTADARRSA